MFFDGEWTEVGTKSSLQDVISDITGIWSPVLLMNRQAEISVAQRMFWASNRVTTKVEDKAYCLMGLFGVNMPLIYGEGENAFLRLQLEILKSSDDHSIFAWTGDSQRGVSGLLARSPKDFGSCSNIGRIHDEEETLPFSMTNKGLRITLPLIPINGLFLAVLNCRRRSYCQLAVYLQKVENKHSVYYRRVHTTVMEEVKAEPRDMTEVYIKETDPSLFDVSQWMKNEAPYIFSIRKCPAGTPHITYHKFINWKIGEEETKLTIGGSGHSAILVFKDKRMHAFVVTIGVHNYNLWCDIATDYEDEDIRMIAQDYWDGKRANKRWENKDRKTILFPEGDSVSLAIKRGKITGERGFLVEVGAREGFELIRLGHGCCWWNEEPRIDQRSF